MRKTVMRKACLFLASIVLLSSRLSAVNFSASLCFGLRTVNDSQVRGAFGNGPVYFPCLAVNFWKGFILGGGYEGGYSRTAKLGLYQESSTLEITGFEIFLGYQIPMGKFCPYIKIGFGSFNYRQSVDNPVLEEFKIDKKDMAIIYGGGIRYYPLKNIFLAGEIKMVHFSVSPVDTKVDLGGFRFLAGVGCTI
jgi:opacity protein-like surface antigen